MNGSHREQDRRRRTRRTLAATSAVALAMAVAAPTASAVTVWAVGDGGVAGPEDDQLAARIETEAVDHFIYLGDVYETGTADEFATRYHPSFGRFKAKSSPTVGNHEWANRAVGYDPYWGASAPQQAGGGHYYSFDFGGWHFISLNTEEPAAEGSAQLAWLRGDLAANPGECTIALTHKARYSASFYQDDPSWEPIWSELAGARAIALLSGHDHDYQRFKPNRGVVQFVVGSGGRELRPVNPFAPDLAAYNDTAFGALRMTLTPSRLDFAFVPTTGAALDSGSLPCPPASDPPGPPVGGQASLNSTAIPTLFPRPTAPVLSATSLSPVVFRASGVPVRRGRNRPRPAGTRVRFALSETASVRMTLQLRAQGRRVGSRCLAPTRTRRRLHLCTRFLPRGLVTFNGRAGANSLAFSGRVGGRALAAGVYRATLLATDSGGLRSSSRTLGFTVVSR